MNNYYDVSIKEWRLSEIEKCAAKHTDSTYQFYKGDLADKAMIDEIFSRHKPSVVVNLGAQAGVRYSITNPDAYIQSNMIGFYNILEACRHSYDNGEAEWSIWYMRPPLQYTEPTKKFHIPQMIR